MAYTAAREVLSLLSPTFFQLISAKWYIHILNHYFCNDAKLKRSIKASAREDALKMTKD